MSSKINKYIGEKWLAKFNDFKKNCILVFDDANDL